MDKHIQWIQRIRTVVAIVAIVMAAFLFWKIRTTTFSAPATSSGSVKIISPSQRNK